jgi:hypothetical protein
LAVFNTGSNPHRQHFYGDSVNDAPLSAYKGDKFHEQTGDHLTYIFNGTIWELDESSVNIKEKGISVTDGTQVYQSYEKDLQGYGVKRVTIAAYPSLTLTHTKIEVGTTTTSVLSENLNRKYLLIFNDSDKDIYISFGSDAEIGQGILISAKGHYEQNPWIISTQAINAIHGDAEVTKNLLVTEGV